MVAGNHQVRFNASSLASGFYVYRLTVNDGERTFFRKMMLLK
jgi:hypothetical protein